MDELLRRLRSLPGNPGTWGYLLCPRQRVLDGGGREFRDAPAEAVERLGGEAVEAWGLLTGAESKDDLGWCCAAAANRPFAHAEAGPLRRRALDHFAAAMVLGWLRHAADPNSLAALEAWLAHFAHPGEFLPPLRHHLGRLPPGDLAARVQAAARLLPPAAATRLRLAARHQLRLPLTTPNPPRPVRVHFPTYDDFTHDGAVYALDLELLPDGDPGLFPDPACLDLPTAGEFRAVVEAAHGLHTFPGPVVWGVRRLTDPTGTTQTVRGESHSAAACVAFRALAASREVDPGCVLSAQFPWTVGDRAPEWGRPSSALRGVGGLRDKYEAVCALNKPRFGRFLHNDPAFAPAHRPVPIDCPATLEDAYQIATGLIGEVRRYYAACAAFLDRDRAVYLGARRLSDLYIEPDVLRDVVRLEREPAGRDPEEGPPAPDAGPDKGKPRAGGDALPEKGRPRGESGTEEKVKLQADSDAEEKFRDKLVERRERVAWKAVWPGARRAVIVGDPGEGKSVLAKHLLLELAGQGVAELDAGGKAVGELATPVFVRLADLAESADPDDAIRAAVQRVAPPGQPFSDALVTHVLETVKKSGVLILDGFDEVPSSGHQRRLDHLRAVAAWPCRVVLTSRPYGYQRGGVPFPEVQEFELAPLADGPRAAFVAAWFRTSARPDWQARVQELAAGAGLQQMSRNAFLLTLLCAEAEVRDLPASARRPTLYRWIVLDLLRGAWRQDPPPIDENDATLDVQLRVLRRACWHLLGPSPARYAFARDEWFDALEQAGYSTERAGALLNEWQARGVLLPLLVQRHGETSRGWAFAHRSILEFLAAEHVARLPDPVAAINRYLWTPPPDGPETWEPDAQEFLPFLAGCMTDPSSLLSRMLELDAQLPDALYVMARLAGRCLTDIDADRLRPPGLLDQVLDRAEGVYWGLGRTPTLARALAHPAGVRRLEQRLAADGLAGFHDGHILIKQLAPASGTPGVLAALLAALRGEDEEVRSEAVGALGGVTWAGPGAVAALVAGLRDEDEEVRYGAAVALRSLGPWAGPGVAAALLDTLRDRDNNKELIRSAARALGSLGAGAALVTALGDEAVWVRSAAAEALGRMGAGAGPAGAAALAAALRDPVVQIRAEAATALGSFGTAVGPEAAALLDALRDPAKWVRSAAARALGRLEAAAGPGAGDALLAALRDAEGEVRYYAAKALGGLGAAVGPEVEAALVAALRDENETVRVGAAKALGRLGAAAALVAALRYEDRTVRSAAAEALRSLGPAAGPAGAAALVVALRDRDWGVRMWAAEALGSFGPAAGPAGAALVAALRDENESVRAAAAKTLGSLGPAAGPAKAALVVALRDQGWKVRQAAVGALVSLGAAGPELLDDLVAALRDTHRLVRSTAAHALGVTAGPAGTAALVAALQEKDGAVRASAADGLWWVGLGVGPAGAAALVAALQDQDGAVREAAARALGSVGPEAGTGVDGALLAAIRDPGKEVRLAAAQALGKRGVTSPGAVASLRVALSDGHGEVCVAAAKALERLLNHRNRVP
ncbi:MAG: hypothetical protein C0501_07895 [Isosphaera sp.]|nr:hypothetical protein [Isosphaera sp.]